MIRLSSDAKMLVSLVVRLDLTRISNILSQTESLSSQISIRDWDGCEAQTFSTNFENWANSDVVTGVT